MYQTIHRDTLISSLILETDLDVVDRRRRGVPRHNVHHADIPDLSAGDSLLQTHEVRVEATLEGHKARHARLLHAGRHL